MKFSTVLLLVNNALAFLDVAEHDKKSISLIYWYYSEKNTILNSGNKII